MNKTKRVIMSIIIIIVVTILVILATYIENLPKIARILIDIAYVVILIVTIIWTHRKH